MLERMVAPLRRQPVLKEAQVATRAGGGICRHHGLFDHAVLATHAQAGVALLLDGWIRGGVPAGTDAAQACLDLYLAQGPGFVKQLNGQFNVAIWDDRGPALYLLNDRYGLRPLQYAVGDGSLYFAPEAKAILAAGGRAPRLDPDMVANYLSISRIHLGDRTFFEGVRVLPPASILAWTSGRVTLEAYWDYTYRPAAAADDDFVAALATAFEQAVARWIVPGRRLGITLSGGLDSRLVAAALARQAGQPVTAFTYGILASDEVQTARQVADRLGLAWQGIPLGPDDFIADAAAGARIMEGLDIFVQSYALKVFPSCAQAANLVFNGLALDIPLGGSYLEGVTEADPLPELLYRKLAYFKPDQVARLFRDERKPTEIMARLSAAFSADDPPANRFDAWDRFILKHRVHRCLAQRQYWQRLYFEDATPTFDNDLVDLLLQIPAAERQSRRLYQRVMRQVCPDLMDIPYQRTLLPPAAPVEFWKESAALEAAREAMLERLYAQTQGTVYVPYTRYYTNFDEWMRRDPGWIALSDDLLGAGSRIEDQLGLDGSFAREMLDQHRSAQKNHRARLMQLMTLELLLRTRAWET